MQPNEPVVAAFFTELIANHLQNAPIQCGFAGEKKGKAIYAAKALKAGEPVWTEAPFVAMQHEDNKVGAFLCLFYFHSVAVALAACYFTRVGVDPRSFF